MAIIVISKDKCNSVELRLQNREKHLEHIHNSPLKIKLAGPLIKEGIMVGSIQIFDEDDINKVKNFIDIDPYKKADLFESIEITDMKIVIDN